MNDTIKVLRAAAIGGATFVAGLAVGYPIFARSAVRTWGASTDEARRPMPGDELLPDPDVVTTRAITIAAPPEAVWPWLVQFGPERGGIYSYDRIDNLLGVRVHSSDVILPEYQHLAVGDASSLGPSGPTLRVAVLEPERALVFRSDDGHWVWSFGLYPTAGGTRLVSRNRIGTPAASLGSRLAMCYFLEPGSLIMESKMLRGIRDRAERTGPVTASAAAVPS